MHITSLLTTLRAPGNNLSFKTKQQLADLIETLIDDRTIAINRREKDLSAWRLQTEAARRLAGRTDEAGVLRIISDLVDQTNAA